MTKKNIERDPQTLEPIKPGAGKNRRALTIIIVILSFLGAVLYFSVMNDGQKKKDEPQPVASKTETRPLLPGQDSGRGLIVPTPPKELPKKASEEEIEPIKVVGPPPKDPEEEARRRELEELRRKKMEAEQAALRATPMVKRVSGDTAAKVGPGSETAGSGGPAYSESISGNPDGYNPAADQDKENFFSRADQNQWRSPYTREAGRPFELKTGTVIPGVMITGVNSDLPGAMIAQVSQNVYDTAGGRQLLVPQGAKLYGVYDSRVVYGQSRVLIAWNRIIFPDGSSVTLGAMPGADMAGYAGFQDQVDNHYLRIFGSAVLMSLISGGMSYSVDKVSNNDSDSDSTTVQDEMAAALAAQLGQTTLTLLQKNLNIKPTLEIRPGYRFNVVVTKDVVFRGAYEERR